MLIDLAATTPPPRLSTADISSLHVEPLTPAEQAEFARLASRFLTIPFCPWQPNPGPQEMFLLDFGFEALYGGAVGGSKSVGLMMGASQFLEVPGYAALLLRRTYPDLNKPGALMDLAQQWWGGNPSVRFDREQHTYHFSCPGGGTSRVVFGFLDTENDRFKYQGGAYSFVGFDETTQFKMRDYLYLFSRVRKVNSGPLAHIPLRIRGATNPGGTGHEWVHTRFIAPWQAWREGKGPRPPRNFHPATLKDNPHLDYDEYLRGLMELDPVTRAQLLKGDWNIRPDGRMFRRDWIKPIARSDVPTNCTWVRAWDTAATDPAPGIDPDWMVGVRMGRDTAGNYFIDDMRRWRTGPSQSDEMMKSVVTQDTRRVTQLMEQEPGSGGKVQMHHYRVGPMAASALRVVPSSGKSRGRTTTITAGRHTPMAKILAAGPFASHCEAGLVHMVVDGGFDHEALLSELEIFPDGVHDDIADCLSLAVNELARMPSFALTGLEETNTDLIQRNGWRPEAVAWKYGGGVTEGGWLGERIDDARKRIAQEGSGERDGRDPTRSDAFEPVGEERKVVGDIAARVEAAFSMD